MEDMGLNFYLESLLEYDLEYVGVINPQGRMIEHASRRLFLSDEKLEMLCMGIRLQYSMQSDFDEDLGKIDYVITDRGNLRIVSLPIRPNVLLAIGKKGTEYTRLIEKVCSKEFSDVMKKNLDKVNVVALEARTDA